LALAGVHEHSKYFCIYKSVRLGGMNRACSKQHRDYDRDYDENARDYWGPEMFPAFGFAYLAVVQIYRGL